MHIISSKLLNGLIKASKSRIPTFERNNYASSKYKLVLCPSGLLKCHVCDPSVLDLFLPPSVPNPNVRPRPVSKAKQIYSAK